MSAELNFDANQVPPSTPFEPVPADTYRAHITESEVKKTKDGKGRYLQFTWEILDGPYKGRKFWDRLNIVNANATAQEIAQRALSAVCHATGVLRLTNSAQLHHKPVMVKVTVKQSQGYEPQNEVKGYKACDGAGVPLPAHGSTLHGNAAAGAVEASSATVVPPWAAKKAS